MAVRSAVCLCFSVAFVFLRRTYKFNVDKIRRSGITFHF